MMGIFVFLFSFLVYLSNLAPTVTAEDSGELITASYFLGIPHPSGYPTWCLFSHPFVYIPFGSIAWRVNLSSAFFASCTVLFVFLFVYRLSKSRIAAISGALLFAFSLEFWEQSVITEVYALNALFLILCLYLLYLWKETYNPKYLLWLSFFYGISLGNHYTMFVVGPLLALFVLLTNPDNKKFLRTYVYCCFIVLLSWMLMCSYLYIRSISNPPMDWGNPENFTNLFYLITRKQYAFMFTQYPRSLGRLLKQCNVFFSMGLNQFGSPLLFLLCLLSFLPVFVIHKSWGIFLFLMGFVVSFLAILVQNFNFDLEWLEVMSVFAIPLYLCYSIVFGIILGEIIRWSNSKLKKLAYYLLCSLILLLPLIPLYKNYEINDFSEYWFADEFGRNILNSMSPNAIYIPFTDHASFPLIYLQKVEGVRSDVSIGRVYGYLSPELFEGMDKTHWAKYAPFPKRRYEDELIGWLIDNTERPIYSERKVKVVSKEHGKWVPAGILYRYQRENEEVQSSDTYWQKYRWKCIKEENIKDLSSALIWLQIQWAKARDCFEKNESETAIELIKNGIKHYGEDDVILNNAGALCAEYKDFIHAKEFFEKALQINRENAIVMKNLQKAERKINLNKNL
ncbi:MAG TPA: DUF2723 domain-containing protein [Candidatus Hydrogenedens sp.]|nr:DUF2723 domain-containing protein [Candidatus Hydrogenedens sp.]